MDKKSKKVDDAETSDEPRVFTAIHRDPKYRKANAEFLTRRLRLEFDKLTTARPLCKGATCIRPLPAELQKCRQIKFKSNPKKSRKRKFPSYTKMREEREEFRKTLISLIVAKENEDKTDDTFPNSQERQLLRYYYYIKHGIDTNHIAPMTKRMLNKILRLVPKRLIKWQDIIDANVDEIKSEYIFISKKAVIDFVLGKSLDNSCGNSNAIDAKTSRERNEIKEIGKHHAHIIHVNRRVISRNLYAITPCLRHMLSLWQTTYTKLSFINADELLRHVGTFDLVEFITTINKQIEDAREILCTKWYDALKLIFGTAMKKKVMPDATKPKALNRFFDCVASQMTSCLQDIAVRSLQHFVQFMKNRSNPRIRLHVLLKDEDRLVFSPTFVKIHTEILHIIENVLAAVQNFVRIETTMPMFYDDMQRVRSNCLKPIISTAVIDECRAEITAVLEEERIVPELMLQDFDQFFDLMNGSDAEKIYNFMNISPAFEEYCDLINHYNDVEYEISVNIWGIISIGFYEFHRTTLIETLEILSKFMQTELLTKMVADQQADMAQLQSEYEEISKQALTIPKNTAELMNSKAYAERTQEEVIPEMEKRLKLNLDHFLWLMDQIIYTPLEIKQNSITFQWYLKMPSVFLQNQKIVEQKTIEYQELLKKRIDQFGRDLDLYWEQLLEYENWGDITIVAKYKRKANVLDARLTAALEKIERINEEEKSFGWPLSDYPLRHQTHVKLMPYKKLFDAGQDFIEKRDLWLKNGQVGSFDPVDIAKSIETIYDDLLKLSQGFDEHPHSKRLAEDIKTIIDEFKLNLPIIQTLGNPGLKLRHWEQISEMVGFPIVVSPELTLEKIIEFGLDDYLARFEKISQSATKENGLELAMSNMIVEWQGIEFSIHEYRDTGTYILASVNDIQTLLDDHIIKTQTMKNSPYIKPFESEILSWESKLVLLQEILDEWLRVQTTWIYLEPIFSSPDIQQQMPEEGRRFGAVDKIWKELMKQVHLDPAVMSVVDIDKMSEKLKKAFQLLEIIQKGLHTYLEKKRLYFPRFYFLSNDGLLEILAETKDPTQVQLHLKKCFDGISSLTFTDTLEVAVMKSAYDEEVELTETISTAKARGQVEKWLLELERIMKETVFAQIFDAIESYSVQEFGEWISQWPGQFVHATFLINFTKEIDSALVVPASRKSHFDGIARKLENHIEETISLLRRCDVSSGKRLNFRTLLILLIQAQNILNRLIEKDVQTPDDFDWMGQMRYYFDGNKIEIATLLSRWLYGFEYIGNKSRMVITPLTDRCYRTIFVALNQHFGLVLQGEAGIGKTEMVKDLAKAIATYCISFNCAHDLDYIVMSKFFKGLAACGSWVCFDNFNHIKSSVLSVVAHYMQTIQMALKSSSKQQNFIIDGTSLLLNRSCAIFTTFSSLKPINCHEKLHDNLKTLFRPISMMLPDLQRIAEIELLSHGYENAKSLGTKIITLFQLCKEQLIAQPHYDFRMRTIKVVLEMSERAKINSAADTEIQNEEAILIEIIRKTIMCTLDDEDLCIFESILSDIFPNNNKCNNAMSSNSPIHQSIYDACIAQNINATKYFVGKVYELYEMLHIRTGVMVVGDSFSGKTTAYRVLTKALAILEEQQTTTELKESHPVCCVIINPKSVTIGQLYGGIDAKSQEWRDGILAINFKHFNNANVECKRRMWLIFDGPVDTIWMESINSVLDDNRKLCLTSGDVFYLNNSNLIFEPMDLANASPAIVSRCGVIYMSSSSLGWLPLLESWKAKLPKILEDVNKQEITNLFMRFCPILLHFIRNEAIEMLPTTDSNLVTSLMNIFECFFDDYYDEKTTSTLTELDIRAQLEGMFFFSCIWSLGGALNEMSRTSFSELFHGLLLKDFPAELYKKFNIPDKMQVAALQKPYIFTIPKVGTVFDYRFICEGKGKWKLWSDEIALAPSLSRDIPVNQIIITTKGTVRIYALLDLLLRHDKATLLVGQIATGKTIYAHDYLAKKIDQHAYVSISMNFTVNTTANQVQEIIMGRLTKRRKGVFGPPLGKKCVIFVDDLSLPDTENHSQSAVELLRMWMDHSMWYEQKDFVPIKLIELQIMCAMLSPRFCGRSVSPRFLRHFNIISIDEFDNETLRCIFSKIVLWHLDARGFSKEFDPCIDEIVLGTLSIYNEVREVLLPTPLKSHYQFNVRDFSRVIHGVLLSVPEAIEGIDTMRRLWAHEIGRVYGDRLITASDQKWLFERICQTVENQLHTAPQELFSRFIEAGKSIQQDDLRKLMFCDYTNPKADTRNYLEVQDLEELRYVVECYLVEFNNMSKRPMNLTMFRYTVEHLSRICRVLKQPRSHLLLIGIGGSGRQSLTRLAAHIMDYELFQIELTRNYSMNEWTEFLKAMLLKVSSTESHGVFLITDAQMKDIRFLDDISNLLQSGEVLRLFDSDEIKDICEKMSVIDKQRDKTLQTDGSPKALYDFFVNLIREQLHVIICASPENAKFHDMLRDYPSFINCCTLDWFHMWPDDGLQAVSERFLTEEGFEQLTEPQQTAATEMFMEFFKSSMQLTKEIWIQHHQHIYIPMWTYVESINIFKDKLVKKRQEFMKQEKKFQISLERVAESSEQMVEMQESIDALEPECKLAAEKVAKQVSDVQTAQESVDEQREFVKKDELIVSDQMAQANDLFEHCKNIMEDVLPQMKEAEEALSSLTPADLASVRTMKSPPMPVKIVMETICILRDIKPEKATTTIEDFWSLSKKMLTDPKYVEYLLTFDKDMIPDHISEKLQEKVLSNDAFDVEKIKLISVACELLCKWVIAIVKYDRAAKIALPKRIELKEAETIRDASIAQLNSKIEELRLLEDNLSELQKQLKIEKDNFEGLKSDNERCTKRLQRATEIVGSLGGERDRWHKSMERIQIKSKTLIGDVLISSGIVSYLGQLTETHRRKLIQIWIEKCTSLGLYCDPEFKVENVFADKIQVKSWNVYGLPDNRFTIESAIILQNTRRWTLIIDPQGFANKWIKNLEKENRLCCIQESQPDYLRVLENAIQYGLPVLLENVGLELEANGLESVLMKEVFRQSGSRHIKLGESIVEYNDAFKIYLTTKLTRPHYPAEVSAKVAILDFRVPTDGMESYLLGVAVSRDRPDVEAEKNQIVTMRVDTNRTLLNEETKILDTLSTDDNLLENDTSVQLITTSKMQINELLEKINVAKMTEKQIDTTRAAYKPLAAHASTIYFTIDEMMNINQMYQYSLSWFVGNLTSAIDNTDKVDDIQQRIRDLKKYFTYFIYTKLCRSLEEKEKIVFSTLLTKNISISEKHATKEEWAFLFTCGNMKNSIENDENKPNWISSDAWARIKRLSMVSAFADVVEKLLENESQWENYAKQMESVEINIVADGSCYRSDLTSFQKLLLFICFQPSKLVDTLLPFICEILGGSEFIESPPFDLTSAFADSTCCKPLLFILSSNYDPIKSIRQLAETQLIDPNRLTSLSMGQQQNSSAIKLIEDGIKSGDWVILQNCHLATDFMCTLERICDNLAPDTTNQDFRLWLTSNSTHIFPLSIIHGSVKLVNEPPKTLRTTLMRTFSSQPVIDDNWISENKHSNQLKALIYSLSFLHGIILERRNYNSIGWNYPYDFNDIDLFMSIYQFYEYLNAFKSIPFEILQILIAECIYGGHMNDFSDRKCLKFFTEHFCSRMILEHGKLANDTTLANVEAYFPHNYSTIDSIVSHIKCLDGKSDAEICGLHYNANTLRQRNESNFLIENVRLAQNFGIPGGEDYSLRSSSTENERLLSCVKDILEAVPSEFDLKLNEFNSTLNADPLNLVLHQELRQYNQLLRCIRNTSIQVLNAIQGQIILSRDIETVAIEIANSKIPDVWLMKSYPTLKSLATFVKDLKQRIAFFQAWIETGSPRVYWLPSFFSVRSFFAAIQQNHSRKHNIAYNLLTFDYLTDDPVEPNDSSKCVPDIGCLVNGLYLDGAAWCRTKNRLIESKVGILFDEMVTHRASIIMSAQFVHLRILIYALTIDACAKMGKKINVAIS
ncbi:LOW QUALITY PROTEIN: dynein heavy chain 7, axonemal [Contarinia nasturtii]|uniref:LOW QUALITY PROTEIN: dynein heavy chain 7, axonemal n=1 Tax=Contarinia nasturtii TaxID=265458 RepID=UPI0012D3D631|nr:LOW QUALITY PROTEIN: dynein heavy chain 7, axonemal [Contarinia nasturtii]